MKYFDAHTHLNLQFEQDWKEAGERALLAGVQFVIVGAGLLSSELAIEQAEYFGDSGFATVGIHPTEGSFSDFEKIIDLAKNDKVVAIGECGLEYRFQNVKSKNQNDNSKSKIKEKQKELFIKHIELALEVKKPLMIHCRDGYDDLYRILSDVKKRAGDKLQFNLHFFTSDWLTAEKFLGLGAFLSFPGVITFTSQYDEVIKNMPLDRIMAETDAPFAAPEPFRGKRNEPVFVKFVAERIAELRPEPREEILSALVANTKGFYNLI